MSSDAMTEREDYVQQKNILKLFTTATCPNCCIAKEKLHQAEIFPEVILAEEQPELCTQYGIMQTPTLVAERNADRYLFVGVSEILRFIANCGKK